MPQADILLVSSHFSFLVDKICIASSVIGTTCNSRVDMAIRNATAADVPAIHEIYNHYISTSIANLSDQPAELFETESTFNDLQAKGYPYLVAVDDTDSSIVLGYAYARDHHHRSGFRFSAEDSIYLHPDHTGMGYGRLLMEELLVLLEKSGKTQVLSLMSILPETKDEELPNARLHAQLGFKVVGRMEKVGWKLDQWVDVLIMQKALV